MSVDRQLLERLPTISEQLFAAKKAKKLTFEQLAQSIGKGEVFVASIFYGQAKPDPSDIVGLAKALDLDQGALEDALGEGFYPDRCKLNDLPPRDPVIYRLYEVVANFGYSYKAIIHEKFGDGIMSAISFSTEVEKEMIDGAPWVKITLLGKFLPFKRF